MDRFLFISNPKKNNETTKENGYLLLHTVSPSMIISIEMLGNDKYISNLKDEPNSIIYESNFFSQSLVLRLTIAKALDFKIVEDDVSTDSYNQILKRAGRWFISFLKTAESNDPDKGKIISRNPELGNAAEDLNLRFSQAIDSYNDYFSVQLKEGKANGWHFSDEELKIREKKLKQHCSELGKYMCLLLETSAETIEQEEWGTPGYYLPNQFEYQGMECQISGLKKMSTFEIGFDSASWYLRWSINYPECISKVSDQFWRLLNDVSQFGVWNYDSESLAISREAEKDFKFAFSKRTSSSVFKLIRNYLLETKYNNPQEGSFGIGAIVVRFDSFIDFLDLSFKVQVTMAHLMKCHLILFNERNKKTDHVFMSVRRIHENEIKYPETRINSDSVFLVSKSFVRPGDDEAIEPGTKFKVTGFNSHESIVYVSLESSNHKFLYIKKTDLQEAIITKNLQPIYPEN
ncbi:MAG TPA: hypothetical protein VGQ53_20535 [Chitinophagaceae bacterium]|jgi:hypothetical protein|nr:hypothetical protein [Chitinophagaceae bacterium]